MDEHLLVEDVHGSDGEDHRPVLRVRAHLLHQVEELAGRLVELDHGLAVVAVGRRSDQRLHVSDRLGVHARERVEDDHTVGVKEAFALEEHDYVHEVADVDAVDLVAVLGSEPPVFLQLQPRELVSRLYAQHPALACKHAQNDVEEDFVGPEPDVAHRAGDVVDACPEAVLPRQGGIQLADAARKPPFRGGGLKQLAQRLWLHLLCACSRAETETPWSVCPELAWHRRSSSRSFVAALS